MEKIIGKYISRNYYSHSYSKIYLLLVYLYVYLLIRNNSKQEVSMFSKKKKKKEMDMTLIQSNECKIEAETQKISTASILCVSGHILFHLGFIVTGNIALGLGLFIFGILFFKSAIKRHEIMSDTTEKALAA